MTATTLAQMIEPASVGFDELEKDYRPLLKLVEQLIGVVPNCDPVLEIWPPGFRSYNLLVPNLLNLPISLVGQGAPKDLVGLAMYTASRAAECMYCSAHTCSFALRRGTTPEALVGDYSPIEAAVARVAEGISKVPADLSRADVAELESYLPKADIEWIVLSVAMMGFLNKFMDTMGIELEEAAVADVEELIGPTGWQVGKHGWNSEDLVDLDMAGGRPLRPTGSLRNGSGANGTRPSYLDVPQDSLGTYLKVIRQAPAAIRKERQWTKGMSSRIAPALLTLEADVGHSFPILASLHHSRGVRSIATVLRDNLDPELSVLGLRAKCLVGLVYARVVGNEVLTSEAIQLALTLVPDIDHPLLTAVGRFAHRTTGDGDIATAALQRRGGGGDAGQGRFAQPLPGQRDQHRGGGRIAVAGPDRRGRRLAVGAAAATPALRLLRRQPRHLLIRSPAAFPPGGGRTDSGGGAARGSTR